MWPALWLFAAAAFVLVNVVINWTGYIQSDDQLYAGAAEGWLQHVPYLGTTHWAIRHLIVLPIALMFAIFGRSEAALMTPAVLYALAVIVLLASIANRLEGWRAAAITVAITGSLPAVATGASFVSTDLPEALFIIGSVWAYDRGCRHGGLRLFFISGALAGCAVITRETTAALLVLYAALFVAGRGRNMPRFLAIAAGFATVAGADFLYLFSLSHDPLYRLHIAKAGADHDGPQMQARYATATGVDRFGVLNVPRFIKPVTTILLNQNFGLFFWFAVPATALLSLRGSQPVRDAARLFGGLMLTWVLVLGYALSPWLWVIPRYYVTCVVLAVPLAIWFAQRLRGPRWRIAAAGLMILLGSNLALGLGTTSDTMAGERALVSLAAASPQKIYTDPSTLQSAGFLLETNGVSGRVSADPPPSGSTYLFNNRPHRGLPAGWPIQTPPASWVRLQSRTVGTKWTAYFARVLDLRAFLPAGLVAKLDPLPHVIAVYRVTEIGPAP